MTAFSTPIDIVNRGLQRLGADRITAFADDSKAASEANACYDRLRQSELERNLWRCSIRTIALYAVTTTTKLLTFGTYDAMDAPYVVGDIVLGSDGVIYQSNIPSNSNDPATVGTGWTRYFGPDTADTYNAATDYFAGDLVKVSSTYYLSLINANGATPPSANWLALTTQPTAVTLQFLYPIGAGPQSDSGTRNVYRLPVGFLCIAPQDPLNPAFSSDWLYQDNYIVTQDVGPIIYRFGADITDVSKYHAMLCEGLASRIAFELCESLTQSITKLGAIGKEYQQFMAEARTKNAIETGPVSPEEDSWVSVKWTGCFDPRQWT